MNKIVGIFLNILIVIIVLILLFVLYNLLQTSLLKKKYTNFFGYTVLQIATGSMRNTLHEKDVILVKILDPNEKKLLQEGDIVLFEQGNSLIVHRIIKKEGDTFITKGDANNAEDKPVQADMMIGKMVEVISRVGIWEKVLTTPKVYISLLITLSLFGITFLYGKGERKENAKEKHE